MWSLAALSTIGLQWLESSLSSRIPHVNCLKLFKGQMHQLISWMCFVWQWMCEWFSEARAEKRAQRWWKAWLDLFWHRGVPNTRWFLRIQGRDVLLMFEKTKAPHAAQTSQHIFSINAAMLQNIALVNMYMGRAAQRKAHSPDHENEHWQLSSWMIERQDSADCQRFKWQNGSSYNEVLQPDTLQACLLRSWLELQSWLERDGGPSKAKFASLVQ